MAWIFTALVHILLFVDINIFVPINSLLLVLFTAITVLCHIIVYRESRRHEQQIAYLQVTAEVRENFLRQKRALKLTATVVSIVIISYLPATIYRMTRNGLKSIFPLDALHGIFFSTVCLISVNSLINPLVYCIRLRQFRVAFIQLLFKKSLAQAEEYEKKVFGWTNATVASETNQGGETEEQTTNQANAINDMEANQRGEREEQYVSQANALSNMETYQGGEREEQYMSAKPTPSWTWKQTREGRERSNMPAKPTPSSTRTETREGRREEQYVSQANAFIDMEENLGGEREEQAICQPSQRPHYHPAWKQTREGRETKKNQTKPIPSTTKNQPREERDEQYVSQANTNHDIEGNQGGETKEQQQH